MPQTIIYFFKKTISFRFNLFHIGQNVGNVTKKNIC